MKKISIIISLSLIFYSCGGSDIKFQYTDNSRIVIEGTLIDENGNILKNQSAELYTFISNSKISVKKVNSKDDGMLYLSVPLSNLTYALVFENKKIMSSQHFHSLVLIDNNTHQNTGIFYNLKESYYNFGTIKLTSN